MSPREEPTGTFPVQRATSMWSLGTCADSEKKKYVLRKRDRKLEMEWKQKRTEEHTDPASQNKANILELLVNM